MTASRGTPVSDAVSTVLAERLPGYERSPSDVMRIMVFAALTAAACVLAWWGRNGLSAFESDVARLWSFLTPAWERLLAGALQIVVAVALVATFVLPLAARQFRMLGYVAAAALAAPLLVLGLLAIVGENETTEIVSQLATQGARLRALPNAGTIAALCAAYVVTGPFVSAQWRSAGRWTLTAIVVIRFIVTAHLPGDVLVALTGGAAVGAAVLVAFGRPNLRPSHAAIIAALDVAGVHVTALDSMPASSPRSGPFSAAVTGGGRVFVRVHGDVERSADLLYRAYRAVRFKNLGLRSPFMSVRRDAEHEALASYAARDAGVRSPRLRAIAAIGNGDVVLAYDEIDGRAVDMDGEMSDAELADLWHQIASLRCGRVAHRDLRRSSLVVDRAGAVWVVGLQAGIVGADENALAGDVANALAAIAPIVGVEPAVDAAVEAVGRDAVAGALGRLQPQVLPTSTRAALGAHDGMLDELRTVAADRCGVEVPALEPFERLTRRTLFTFAMFAALIYFLAPQLADLPGIVDRVREANWWWAIPTVAASAVSYFGAGTALFGAVPHRIPVVSTFVAQFATGYANLLAPAGVGGIVLNARYLERVGVDAVVATSSAGLAVVAGFCAHLVLLVLFVGWAGRSAFGDVDLPNPEYVLIGVVVVVVIAAVALAVPAIRGLVREKLFPMLRRAAGGLRAVVTRPLHMILLTVGAVVVTFAYMTALYFASQAFGATLSYAQVGAVFLVGSAVASVAPTPGGLGALEAALIAGFTAAGVDGSVAVPAVFFYRLATFWLPILPGASAYQWLRRAEYL
ncbi:MAG TPA: lysylphosphatidylglycerol synthase transmembrane domain-containing protein [Microthrixaceae bacterium]|nr:lysylphosphatidylglycerol synthase transmembrane domain-containing protein [Microthrixaceae bacterium]